MIYTRTVELYICRWYRYRYVYNVLWSIHCVVFYFLLIFLYNNLLLFCIIQSTYIIYQYISVFYYLWKNQISSPIFVIIVVYSTRSEINWTNCFLQDIIYFFNYLSSSFGMSILSKCFGRHYYTFTLLRLYLSWTISFQSSTLNGFRFSSTTSINLFLGLPLSLLPCGFHSNILL